MLLSEKVVTYFDCSMHLNRIELFIKKKKKYGRNFHEWSLNILRGKKNLPHG